jgi:hypothetical protein
MVLFTAAGAENQCDRAPTYFAAQKFDLIAMIF